MTTLIIPGRHLITSAFMERYLETLLRDGIPASTENPDLRKCGRVIIPITSANQHGSRYNPVPLYARIIGLERLIAPLRSRYGIAVNYVPLPHLPPTPNFAAFTIKYIEAHTNTIISPTMSTVWCSTPTLISDYCNLGFSVLTAEWDTLKNHYHTLPPNDILTTLVAYQNDYRTCDAYTLLSTATQTLWEDMPEIPEHLFRLWRDPLLTNEGSLTAERNYATYAIGMSHSALMDVKFGDIAPAIIEGKIVDEGCADGALMVRLAETFPDSDIIGIDITGEFIARVEERQRAGEFGKSFVYTYQRNLLAPIFQPNSITTTICNSTLHELWSYGEQAKSVTNYLKEKFRQLQPGGRLIIRDVVGPPNKTQMVYLKLNQTDGQKLSADEPTLYHTPTESLSTQSRFFRFAHDFLHDLRTAGRRDPETQLTYELRTIANETYVYLRIKDAMEFLSRKDYHDNWDSEMNEEFAFWDFAEWQSALRAAGFTIVNDPNTPQHFSGAYANPWLVAHRFAPHATLYEETNEGTLAPLLFPVTTMILVGEKPIA